MIFAFLQVLAHVCEEISSKSPLLPCDCHTEIQPWLRERAVNLMESVHLTDFFFSQKCVLRLIKSLRERLPYLVMHLCLKRRKIWFKFILKFFWVLFFFFFSKNWHLMIALDPTNNASISRFFLQRDFFPPKILFPSKSKNLDIWDENIFQGFAKACSTDLCDEKHLVWWVSPATLHLGSTLQNVVFCVLEISPPAHSWNFCSGEIMSLYWGFHTIF